MSPERGLPGRSLFRAALLFLAALLASAAWAKAKEGRAAPPHDPAVAAAELAVVGVAADVARLEAQLSLLREKYLSEVEARDRALLQKRFEEGRELFYSGRDYEGAAEVLFGVVNHPAARKLDDYNEAVYCLAESLYHLGNYPDTKPYYQALYAAGEQGAYFGPSLVRLIELSIIERDYEAAREYYLDFLNRFPKDEDGSFALYLIAKAFYLRGDREKARQLFETVPENSNYRPTARYFLAVLRVEDGDLEGAVKELEELKGAFREDFANKRRLFELVHLSLARLYYELDDYARAMKEYYTIPPESRDYAEALYEALWVFLTRNERVVQELGRERGRYSILRADFEDFTERLKEPPASHFAAANATLIQDCWSALDEIDRLFSEIEDAMVEVKGEAMTAFNRLIEVAPNSSRVPEAEVLLGYALSQVEQYDDSEAWFRGLKDKYAGYKNHVAAAMAEVRTQDDLVALTESVVAAKESPGGAPDHGDLPTALKAWMAEQPGVRDAVEALRRLERQRASIQEMRGLMDQVEKDLQVAEREVTFPVLKSAREKADLLDAQAQAIHGRIAAAKGLVAQVQDEADRRRLAGTLDQEDARLREAQEFLAGIDVEVELKRRQRIDEFRGEFRAASRPLDTYLLQNAQVAADVKQVAAAQMRGKLRQVGQLVDTILLQASLGEIDVAWQRTQRYNKDISEITREQEREIRRFREMVEKSDQPKD